MHGEAQANDFDSSFDAVQARTHAGDHEAHFGTALIRF